MCYELTCSSASVRALVQERASVEVFCVRGLARYRFTTTDTTQAPAAACEYNTAFGQLVAIL
jgi:hypothetical protein